MTRQERHALGLELCRMPGCESCGYYRKRLAEAQDIATGKKKNTRRAGTTAASAAPKSKGDGGASLGPDGALMGGDLS